MKIPLNWLKDYVDIKISPKDLADKLTMAGLEVTAVEDKNGEKIFEIEITPNRPDLLSIIGVAREVAAVTNAKLKIPHAKTKNQKPKTKKELDIKIEDKKGCERYAGIVIGGVKVRPSPDWVIKRLEAVGVRPVNNVVDITNYVLFETGQPLHAFDYDKLSGKKIIVRRARNSEAITTIDKEKRALNENILIIADAAKPIAIAGVMGGLDTEVGFGTKTIMLESAWFDPVLVRKGSRKLGVSSDSSYRFERNVDLENTLVYAARAAQLIAQICGGKIIYATDAGRKKIPATPVLLKAQNVEKLLGINVPAKASETILKRLGFGVKKQGGVLKVSVPSYRRQDITREVDLIEEIARIFGYDKLPMSLPKGAGDDRERKSYSRGMEERIKQTLSGLGFYEVITYSLINEDMFKRARIDTKNIIPLKNPLSRDAAFMRSSILPGILSTISRNLNKKNLDIKLFEIGKVFYKSAHPEEKTNIAIAITGVRNDNWQQKRAKSDFFDLKGTLEALFEALGVGDAEFKYRSCFHLSESASAEVFVGKNAIGYAGKLSEEVLRAFDIEQDVFVAELFVDEILKFAKTKKAYTAPPKYPCVVRDISMFILDDVPAADIEGIIKRTGGEVIKRIKIFDCYKGTDTPKGEKSLAFSLEYQRPDRTLTDEEVNNIHSKIIQALKEKLNPQIRS
ncbi:MAG: phenylalanine--tRNA ligase subunit beta [Candidatus Omnitrophota bacterium]